MSAVNNLDPCPPAAGPAGPPGAAGIAGAMGATGPMGPAGVAGATGAIGPSGPMGPTGPMGPAGAIGPTGATGPAGPAAISADAGNAAVLGGDGLLYVPTAYKLASHPPLPIPPVVAAGAPQPLVDGAHVFATADTDGLILTFGVDGKLRVTARPIIARYTKTTVQTLSSFVVTVVDFDQVDVDALQLVTPGAEWAFTCPVAGYYLVQANLHLTQGPGFTGTPETGNNLFIYQNGAFHSMIDTFMIEPSGRGTALVNDSASLSGSDLVWCDVGDRLDVRVRRTNSLMTIYGNPTQSWTHVAISRLQGD